LTNNLNELELYGFRGSSDPNQEIEDVAVEKWDLSVTGGSTALVLQSYQPGTKVAVCLTLGHITISEWDFQIN